MNMQWRGVIPALTTPFKEDLKLDLELLMRHCQWLVDNGCSGIVALGSLGEGATLTLSEKAEVLGACVRAVGSRVPVLAGISALSTAEAVTLAKTAEDTGCRGLMVLPPYVYLGDWRETKAHVTAVLSATKLSSMLYNNPIAYKVDFIVEQVKELVQENETLQAIKESSSDVRRVTALRAELGERLQVLVGVDDAIVESIAVGAVGWIAGLVNAFPRESVHLFELATAGKRDEVMALYRWFLPLLRMDTVPKFVQLIKLVQEFAGVGNARVRPPRLELVGSEREAAVSVISAGLRGRPESCASTSLNR